MNTNQASINTFIRIWQGQEITPERINTVMDHISSLSGPGIDKVKKNALEALFTVSPELHLRPLSFLVRIADLQAKNHISERVRRAGLMLFHKDPKTAHLYYERAKVLGNFDAWINDAELLKFHNFEDAMHSIFAMLDLRKKSKRTLIDKVDLYIFLRSFISILYQKHKRRDASAIGHLTELGRQKIPLALYYLGFIQQKAKNFEAARRYYLQISKKDQHAYQMALHQMIRMDKNETVEILKS